MPFSQRVWAAEQIEIRDLRPEDAELLGAAEAAAYCDDNPRLINGERDFRFELNLPAAENFSVGALNRRDGRLLAYFVCYVDVAEESEERVAYGCDFAFVPQLRAARSPKRAAHIAVSLLERALGRTREAGLALEGELRQSLWRTVERHPALLERLGYRLAAQRALPDYHGGEDFCWIRLEPLMHPPGR